MALKSDKGVTLEQAAGVRNVFVNDWKKGFYTHDAKKVASIPFLRNLIEFSRGQDDPDYDRLTAMVHWKADTPKLTVADLDKIYATETRDAGNSANATRLIVDLIREVADAALDAAAGLSLVNKVVLAIGTRMAAERYMATKIADDAFLAGIKANQTQALIAKFKDKLPNETTAATVLDRVALMTPENIHLNSFMYEPIIDMGEDHLRKLYSDVKSLA
jgi:hypothetical protein